MSSRPDKKQRPPTITAVAAQAGVSISSVSRILNGHRARPGTVDRVTRAVTELSYVPNAAAQSLKLQRTRQISFSIENVGNPVYVDMFRGAEQVLRPAGYRLVLHSTHADPIAELEVITDLSKRYVDGLIISPIRVTASHLEAFQQSTAPIVVVGTLPERASVDSVEVHSEVGVAMAVEHLHHAGRQVIAFLNGPLDTVPGASRLRGYETGLADAGLEPRSESMETADGFNAEAGQRAAERLFNRLTPDALICANDLIALGALRVLARRQLSVPDDVAVVGVDDTFLASLVGPGLTSVSLRAEARGKAAAELLLSRLDHPDLPPRRMVIEPELSVRGSSTRGFPE